MYKLVKALKSLSDDIRLRILSLLLQRECCVCEVVEVLKISQTRASRNLNMLYDAGFLKLRKEGLWSFYSVDRAFLDRYLSLLVDAVDDGLKDDKNIEKDRERLKEAQQLGQKLCCLPDKVNN